VAALPNVPDAEIQNPAAHAANGLSNELEQLASLHDRGVLSLDPPNNWLIR